MANLKPLKIPLSEVDSILIVEGQFITTTDTSYIFVDISNTKRHCYNQITVITEEDRVLELTPVEGCYFTSDTTNLWYCKNGTWTNVTPKYEPSTASSNGLLSRDNFVKLSKVTSTEMGYLSGITSSVQDQ